MVWPPPAAAGPQFENRLSAEQPHPLCPRRLSDINKRGPPGTCHHRSSWQVPRAKGGPSRVIPWRKQGCSQGGEEILLSSKSGGVY